MFKHRSVSEIMSQMKSIKIQGWGCGQILCDPYLVTHSEGIGP